MAVLQIEYRSDVLDMDRNMNVILPDRSRLAENETMQDIPVLYLLHGMSGNHNSWLKRTGIERIMRYTNLAVIMPSTDMGWYTNTQYGMAYFDALAKELPSKIHEFFPQISTSREKNFIAGNSMGGYGAFKLALSTENFSYAASLSGALSFDDIAQRDIADETYWKGIFGTAILEETDQNHLFAIAETRRQKQDPLPKLYAWCGRQDFLYHANVHAAHVLKNMGYDISFITEDGVHAWYCWDEQIKTLLRWLPIDYVEEIQHI